MDDETDDETDDGPGNMPGDIRGGMPRAPVADKARPGYGPRPLSALLPPLVRPAFRRRAPATAQVLADWELIVGPKIAAATTPLRLAAGTLSLACSGPMAMELQHVADALLGRINGHLGQIAVQRLRFVQSAAPTAHAAPPPPPPRRGDPTLARAAVAALPEGAVRDALERLARSLPATGP